MQAFNPLFIIQNLYFVIYYIVNIFNMLNYVLNFYSAGSKTSVDSSGARQPTCSAQQLQPKPRGAELRGFHTQDCPQTPQGIL